MYCPTQIPNNTLVVFMIPNAKKNCVREMKIMHYNMLISSILIYTE